MNVAAQELCAELYRLGGWENTDNYYGDTFTLDGKHWYDLYQRQENVKPCVFVPAYDLGYLIRKLPAVYENGGLIVTKQADIWGSGYGAAYMTDQMNFLLKQIADTPEDALAKLAIELFKANILVKGEK